MKFLLRIISIAVLLFLFSCQSEDEYIPLEIEANPDSEEVFQNSFVEIKVLQNDVNVPKGAIFTVGNSQNASISVTDPNQTPDDQTDDVLTYIPNGSFVGEDIFEYSICDSEQHSCATGVVTVNVLEVSPVVLDLDAVPYATLSEYHFFEENLSDQNPVYGVVPYEPINSLFTDYAKKKRFVWMPYGKKAVYVSDYESLDFPVGTVLIKNFYYENVQPGNVQRIIETRLLIKKETEWIFAEYVWNADQSEAFLDMEGSYTEVNWLENGEAKSNNYRVPSHSECFTCHKSSETVVPIALKPQNLNSDFSYPEGSKNQLQKLVEFGYLKNTIPNSIETVVPWNDASQDISLRMRSYVDINCAHCHSSTGHCDYRPLRFNFHESGDETNMGVCVLPDTQIPPYTKIVVPGDPLRSVLHFRVSTTLEQYKMPLLGRNMVDENAVIMVEEWINSLTTNCQ
ncbi:MAG TPA: hypothetical protein VFM82_01430 [Flavobacteriaceae bacterium]|nr:hypothetical protein [Flavobacteriaceae bacterium]